MWRVPWVLIWQGGRSDPWTNAAVLVYVPAEGGGEEGSMQVPSAEF